ncbi:winged helix-turn-helix domain-containing protein [Phytohabitans rumicis]|uniref:Transcriptional regulator n=1 Tax=Phytohabitans rumicis TaxID=1076125 RepID=A0A6V8KSU8_9ACTN|nr:winged helix-turn-helix domain-containing protein [Phytohabitans rumicis]GFJ86884.1 transcriptional regulator [Phytohabitans rumicis]
MAMLRIYFTGEDLARTRIASGPDPLWELVLALQMLKPQRGDLLFTGWRRGATAVLRRADLGPPLRLLTALNPNVGYFPDFLNPIEAMRGLEYGLEAIRRTPKDLLRRDVLQLARSRPLPARVREVAEGNPRMLTELTDTMRACHDLIIAPYRHGIETAIDRDRSARVSALAGGGVEGLLGSLRPLATWSAGELRVPTHRDQELHLDGRGLLLVPSYFCVSGPLTMLDPALPPVLIYPIERRPDVLPLREQAKPDPLKALIGATRAAVLQAISTNPGTTEELARRVGISAASASEHAGVLRRSGLVFSYRDGNRMRHQLTPLGLALLEHNYSAY